MTNNLMDILRSDCVGLHDLGLQYGFSLFETFPVNSFGNVFLLDKHIGRIISSACYFGINVPMLYQRATALVKNHIRDEDIANMIVRLTLTAGNDQEGLPPSLFLSARNNRYTSQIIAEGYKLQLSKVRKNETSLIIGHKTGNYLENHLLLADSIKKGFDDVLFMNYQDNITETCKCNIFFVKKGVLYTPQISCGLLPGIIRAWIIENATGYGLPCVEGDFTLEDLIDSDEIFVCNSAMGIMHVKSINDQLSHLGIGPITIHLQNELNTKMNA